MIIPPIKLCLLWHQHQPYYRAGARFLMPWAWLHATKDYLEMAQHLERHPKMRATINLVPSLLKQIEEYLSGEAFDPVIDLMTKPASALSPAERTEMIDNFFLANQSTLIDRSARYRELYDLAQSAPAKFVEQDFRDLAVHYSLAWTGEMARQSEPYASLVAKDRVYSEDDKQALMAAQIENVRRIIPLHQTLSDGGAVELTTTPFYHPILPLLIDTDIAREPQPHVSLPHQRFEAPEEAELQLRRAREFFASRFGAAPRGVWPSEGSISDAALTLIRKSGFQWAASDEAVLAQSLGAESFRIGAIEVDPKHAKFFPWRVSTPSGSISLFFRDRGLSDDIGFNYQSWNATDAAQDFAQKITEIRSTLVASYGMEILRTACIPVILDGENCWEYYQNNGYEFLDELYSVLSTHAWIQPMTFSGALREAGASNLPLLDHVVAGSWINANFRIWIGHPEDNLAWDLLSAAREAYDDAKRRVVHLKGSAKQLAVANLERAHEELLIAEGSDWCWWYGDEHHSPQKNIFDELFRTHLRSVYAHLDLMVPESLFLPIPVQVDEIGAPEPTEHPDDHSPAMSRSNG
ncbi:MAG: glycoside hydrolase family 57 protein [Bacteroidota bacterium]|nr:glycoside hydrolase family 57 protein [Bacteroidota bacterium]MDP4243862.1 glycoside hydrolase family 57 protein [Bacteroidota bacterium]MDP4288804.1 glycoside hydrolase family 57 protein [Bacteroidota bacterium]